jgi:iron complex transport system substrate-binding protein
MKAAGRDVRHRLLVVAVVVLAAVPAGGAAAPSAGGQADDCTFPVTETDAGGTTVTLDAEPERVVTLNPSAAQTMWEIGAKEKVVGVTKYATNLEGAESRTNVSGGGSIVDAEEVVGLEPDLVLAPGATPNETVEKLRDADLTVYQFPDAGSLADIYAKTRTIGRLTGACDGAETTVASMQSEVATVREAVAGEERPDVLYSFYGYTAGNGTFIDRIVETAGGNNTAAAAGIEGYARLNSEVIVQQDPGWIVLNSDSDTLPADSAYNETTAVEEGNVVVVPIEYLNRPAPRVVRAITMLARAFHPEAYAAAQATPTETPTATPTGLPTGAAMESPTDAPTTTPTGTPASGPGFGIVAVLAALVGLVVTLRGGRP